MQLESGKILLKRLVGSATAFCERLGQHVRKTIKPWGERALKRFDQGIECAKSVYAKMEHRIAAKSALLVGWWERRGWPLSLLHLISNALLYLPIDIGWYLLSYIGYSISSFVIGDPVQAEIPCQHLLDCISQVIRLNPHYLLAWLVFAGSVRAGWFYFGEIRPDRRKAVRGGTAENGA